MKTGMPTLSTLSGAALLTFGVAASASAESGEATALPVSVSVSQASATSDSDPMARFQPMAGVREHRIDYAYWDEALGYLVVPMGPSLREGAPRVQPGTGTRRIFGHESRYRLEGNRLAFSFVTDEIRSALTDYRADLERVGSELNIAKLPRNEQLAFWINLHNVAVVEALAHAYPLQEPSREEFGSNRAALDDAKLVTVAGVSLSPRDIRERIVYPNWEDPKVIYGFWRGEIGGPSIQRLAYSGDNVDALLSLSAEEFVNSLRGVEKFSGALQVSRVFEEAAPFYFDDFAALRVHIKQYAREDVKALIDRTDETRYNSYETDLADLSRGERDSGLQFTGTLQDLTGAGNVNLQGRTAVFEQTRINRAITRLMDERNDKLKKAFKRGIRTGMVIYGDGQYSDADKAREVE